MDRVRHLLVARPPLPDDGQDSDSDREDRQHDGHGHGAHPARMERIALHDFLQLIAGHGIPIGERVTATTNEALVSALAERGIITSDEVRKAMLSCPRGLFVPDNYRDGAYRDQPIRVEESEFNISAPHMHATCLEALNLKPGERFLDVGCGCGIIAACAAYLVGKGGEVHAIDIRRDAIELSTRNMGKPEMQSQDYADNACPVVFELHNVFLPVAHHRGRYHKVHVGAACPENRLGALMTLLRPEGGEVVVPVDQELRLIKRKADGSISQRILSHVRFSDLEVPSEIDVVLAASKDKEQQGRAVQVPESTFSADMAAAKALVPEQKQGLVLEQRADVREQEEEEDAGSYSGCSTTGSGVKRAKTEEQPQYLQSNLALALGPTDCMLVGSPGWYLPAHKAALQVRSEQFRAHFNGAWVDAQNRELHVPDSFSEAAMLAVLGYMYSDQLPQLPPEQVAEVLHIAGYYGCSRLSLLCQSRLAAELSQPSRDSETKAEAAAQLLALAEENGLEQLQEVALHYIANHLEEVRRSESYAQLSRKALDLIAHQCFLQHQRLMALLSEVRTQCATLPTSGHASS